MACHEIPLLPSGPNALGQGVRPNIPDILKRNSCDPGLASTWTDRAPAYRGFGAPVPSVPLRWCTHTPVHSRCDSRDALARARAAHNGHDPSSPWTPPAPLLVHALRPGVGGVGRGQGGGEDHGALCRPLCQEQGLMRHLGMPRASQRAGVCPQREALLGCPLLGSSCVTPNHRGVLNLVPQAVHDLDDA